MNRFNFITIQRLLIVRLTVGLITTTLMACNAESVSIPTSLESAETASSTQIEDAAESSPTADLSNDALLPPIDPVLSITAQPGKLVLSWPAQDDTEVVSVYSYDASKGSEQKLDITIDPSSTSLTLPSQTHRNAWHRAHYRVEFCTQSQCVSSQRVAIIGLAEQTTTRLIPAVFIKDELYAQDIASSHDASVFALSRPLEGAIDIHIRSDDQWVLTQHLRLNNLNLSSTRQLYLTLSASGDVIAVLIRDPSAQANSQIRILERLGEAWIETQQLSTTPATTALSSTTMQSTLQPNTSFIDSTLQLSENGNRLMLLDSNNISLFIRESAGWTRLESKRDSAPTQGQATNLHSTELADYFESERSLLTVSGSASLHRIFTLHEHEQQLWLVQWQETIQGTLGATWLPGAPMPVSGLDVSDDIRLKSNDQGSNIAIAGWENNTTASRTPVMWRLRLDTSEPVSGNAIDIPPASSLSVIDSIRLAPTLHTQARLRFTSDNSLSNLAIGWQLEESSEDRTQEDAQLVTYSYHASTRQWLTALELPEAIPTLAKRAFARKVAMSANGEALFLGTAGVAGINANSAEVFVLH